MKAPRIPDDEDARLVALDRYAILDTPPEAAFDQLTLLVAHLLDVPIAFISLVASDRQWFKARHGLDVEEAPRLVSFCGHVVADGEALVVADVLDDERFHDNPLVVGDPNIRFYAGAPLRTPDGHVLGALCAIDDKPRELSALQLELLEVVAGQAMDQLELRRHARELREQREHLRAIIDGMAEGMVTMNAAGEVTACNNVAVGTLGSTCTELLADAQAGRVEMIGEDGRPLSLDEWPNRAAQLTGESRRGVVVGVRRSDEGPTWLSVNAEPLVLSHEQPGARSVVVTFRDVTAERADSAVRERLRQQLEQQQRLVTTGTLAAGLGHEINNPLSYVSTNLQLATEQLQALAAEDPSSTLREIGEALAEAREGVERIGHRVSALRAFSGEPIEARPTAPSEAIELALKMCAHEVRRTATLEVGELTALPPVMASPVSLSQAIVHLVVNAAEAFAGTDPAHNRVRVAASSAGDGRVRFTVSDNGPGMATSVRDRMFEPYFTTKPLGRSAGLGLTIVRTVVDAMGGVLDCESILGAGTTFSIVLPRAPDVSVVSERPSLADRRARVLVVDDEDAILRSFSRILRRRHDVVVDNDPRRSLDRIQRGESFDVVFCDLMMPHMTGVDLYREAERRAPDLAARFVFVSGGVLDEHTKTFLDEADNPYVAKPFDIEEVRGLVEAALASASSQAGRTPTTSSAR